MGLSFESGIQRRIVDMLIVGAVFCPGRCGTSGWGGGGSILLDPSHVEFGGSVRQKSVDCAAAFAANHPRV